MFNRRKRRVALFAIVVGVLAVTPVWLPAGSAPASAPIPLLDAPPLFTAAGRAREVRAIVPGDPDAAGLVVSAGNGPALRYPMRRVDDETWVGTIPPSALSSSEITYAVAADHGSATSTSDEARLVVLDSVHASSPQATRRSSRTIAELQLGPGPDELGVQGGEESATELPPSFAVDVAAKKIHVLDAVKRRIVSFGMDGRRLGKTTLTMKAASDIVVDPDSHDLYVLDQAQDVLVQVSARGQRTWPEIGARRLPFGARLAYDARRHAAYVRDAAQGRHVPVVIRGEKTTGAERSSQARAGTPTATGDLAVEVGARSVTFGVTGSTTRGFEVAFDDDVLEAGEAVVDDGGVIWSLVGLYERDADTASLVLLRLDPDGAATTTNVDPSLPGDVTRRLASAGRGVVLLEGDGRTLRLVGFEEP